MIKNVIVNGVKEKAPNSASLASILKNVFTQEMRMDDRLQTIYEYKNFTEWATLIPAI